LPVSHQVAVFLFLVPVPELFHSVPHILPKRLMLAMLPRALFQPRRAQFERSLVLWLLCLSCEKSNVHTSCPLFSSTRSLLRHLRPAQTLHRFDCSILPPRWRSPLLQFLHAGRPGSRTSRQRGCGQDFDSEFHSADSLLLRLYRYCDWATILQGVQNFAASTA